MDISLSDKRNGTQVEPKTVHGILWLQTHFESNHWEAIASEQVILNKNDATLLAQDANKAGLIINSIPEIAYSI